MSNETIVPYTPSAEDIAILRIVRSAPGLMDIINEKLRNGPRRYALGANAVLGLMGDMGKLKHECLRVLAIGTDLRVVAEADICLGDTSSAGASPAAVLQWVLRQHAMRFILVHNHPTGETRPSGSDDKFTMQVLAAAKAVGMELIDHLIVAGVGFYSYAGTGRLEVTE